MKFFMFILFVLLSFIYVYTIWSLLCFLASEDIYSFTPLNTLRWQRIDSFTVYILLNDLVVDMK
jgi:hypothetical protein